MKTTLFVKGINYWNRIKREHWVRKLRKKNRNHDFSLITNNCVGGVICYDLGEQFRSPTVNLWIPDAHFLAFAQNLQYYLACEIQETPDASKPYPVGTIVPQDKQHIPIEVNFMHYDSFEEGYAKWKARSARVRFDQLFFIWEFHDDHHPEWIQAFDQWNANTLAILRKPIEGVHSSAVVSCYNKNPYNGKLLSINKKTGRRYLDDVDYINFLSRE